MAQGDKQVCILCGGASLEQLTGRHELTGATSLGDALHPFTLLQCRGCGHVQKDLDKAWHDCMNDLYERDYKFVGRHVNYVDGKIVNRDTLAVRKLDEMLSLGEAGDLLDMGCGAGTFLEAFTKEKTGWNVVGSDVGDINRDNVLAIRGAEFYSGLDALDRITRKFDLITCNHVVEHLTDPVPVMKKAASLLKPGGRLAIRVPGFLFVNPDFFVVEHCSHYTTETMTNMLARAGLRVTQEIVGLSAIEVGVIAVRDDNAETGVGYSIPAIRQQAMAALEWAKSLPVFVRSQAQGRQVGIFGVGGAGLWLGAALQGEIGFYVDEDPSKQGQKFAGCPILRAAEIPDNSVVFVTFNNATAAENMRARISAANPGARFLAPPAQSA